MAKIKIRSDMPARGQVPGRNEQAAMPARNLSPGRMSERARIAASPFTLMDAYSSQGSYGPKWDTPAVYLLQLFLS